MWEFLSSWRWSNHRIAAAFLLAPLVPSTVAIMIAQHRFPPQWVFLGPAVIVVMVCWINSMLFAYPVFRILRRREKVNLWTSVASGAIIGGGLFAFVMAMGQLASPNVYEVRDGRENQKSVSSRHLTAEEYATFGELGASASLLGGSIGFFFWLIGVWRNPAFMKPSDQHPEDVFT